MLRVADLIAYPAVPPFPDAQKADLAAIRESLVLTTETGEICSRVFRRLATFPSPQRGAFLFAGNPGVGKTYLLKLIEVLLADPQEPLWSMLQDVLPPSGPPSQPLEAKRIEIPTDPRHDLARFLIRSLGGSAGGEETVELPGTPLADLSARILETATAFAGRSLGMVALENISCRIDNCNNPVQRENELTFLKNVSEVLAHNGVLVLLVVDERHIRPERGRTAAAPLESLAHACDFLWLSRNNIAEIISSRIAPRNAQQRTEIDRIPAYVRRNHSFLDSKSISLSEIYPIHPQTFNAMFALRKILPCFSLLNFVQQAIGAALMRPAEQLVTIDDLHAYALSTCCQDATSDDPGRKDLEPAIASLLRSFVPDSPATGRSQIVSVASENVHALGHDRDLALEWAASLSGIAEIRTLNSETAATRLRTWAASAFEEETRVLAAGLHPLPDALLTTRFQKEVLRFDRYLELVGPVIRQLASGSLRIPEAMGLIRRHFNDDLGELTAWKTLVENLSALVRWLPAFSRYRDYIRGAFPTSREVLDNSRSRLLEIINRPHLLLDKGERDSFERVFLEYKTGYVLHYCALHRDALQIVGVAEEQASKVDATAVRNLELLSSLRHANQIYLHRVRIIGKWLQHNQCDLPTSEILESYPRCYCNFNPDGERHLTQAAEQINSVVQEGLEYFRAVLRQCKKVIIEELGVLRVEERHSRPIAAILSGGPFIPLSPRTMEILNRITEKHAADFLAAIRAVKA